MDFHFGDIMSKALWERIFSVLETPAPPMPGEPDRDMNLSSQPDAVPVAPQPDPATPEQQVDRLWKVRGMMERC